MSETNLSQLDAHLDAHMELRFRVYCLEFGYLSPEEFPDGRERDDFDSCSAHFSETDSEGHPSGYVRLVHSTFGSHFPLEQKCPISDVPPRSESVEISRLVVRQDHRRRRDNRPLDDMPTTAERRCTGDRRKPSSRILLRLYRQMYFYSLQNGIRYWMAAMERPLARSLAVGNFAFSPIGPEIDYYGQVTPYMADLRVLESRLSAVNPRLLSWLRLPPETSDQSEVSCPSSAGPRILGTRLAEAAAPSIL